MINSSNYTSGGPPKARMDLRAKNTVFEIKNIRYKPLTVTLRWSPDPLTSMDHLIPEVTIHQGGIGVTIDAEAIALLREALANFQGEIKVYEGDAS